MDRNERIIGAIVGHAVGDALGVPVEFSGRAELATDPVREMRAFGSHNQPAGTWSDDTSLALCTLESVLECGFDLSDMAQRFAAWRKHGYWSPHGRAFDVGVATGAAIARFEQGVKPEEAGGRGERDNGNGSLMRILPAALFAAHLPDAMAASMIGLQSSVTHAHPRSRLACIIFSFVVSELLNGRPPEETRLACRDRMERLLRSPDFASVYSAQIDRFEPFFDAALSEYPESRIPSSGYVVDTLIAALWCLSSTRTYSDCVLKAVNLGDDTDTTGAVAGGLAGLVYGYGAIPKEWRALIVREVDIADRGARLAQLAATRPPFPASYAVVPGKLYAGEYPYDRDPAKGREKLRALLESGVQSIADLTTAGERGSGAPLLDYRADLRELAGSMSGACEAVRFPIADGSVPDSATIKSTLDFIDANLRRGRSVYVHCRGGRGRSGVIVGCWLKRHGLAGPDSVLSILTELRKHTPDAAKPSPETNEQRQAVVGWAAGE